MAILGIHGHEYLALYRALVMEIDNKCPLSTDRVRGRFCGRVPRNVVFVAEFHETWDGWQYEC